MGAQVFWSLALLALFGAYASASASRRLDSTRSTKHTTDNVSQSGTKNVICYWGSWAALRLGNGTFGVENIDPFLCTHLIYTFAGINAEGTVLALDADLDLPAGEDYYTKVNQLKEKNPKLKTILAIGGWNEASANYSIMAASSDLRRNFINTTIDILSTYGFNGMDLDWEYPAQRDSVNGDADKDNFSTLLKEIKEEFENHNYTLSAAVGSVESLASPSYDIANISQYLDFIHVMTYDLYGPWDSTTGYNSPLHKPTAYSDIADEDYNSVEAAIEYWIAQGAPIEKLAVGIPFYGKTFNLTDADNNSVRANSSGTGIAGPYTLSAGTIGYNELCVMLQNETESWNVTYDTVAEVPYAVQDTNWVSFDNVKSVKAKVKWALSKNITNIFTWSIETDDFLGNCGEVNPLLKAMNEAIGREVNETTT